MPTATPTKLLKQETMEQLDGTATVLSYFAPTEETMQELAKDLFQHNWQRIVVGPCLQGAVFEVCFTQEPRLSYLDGYLTVNLGPWHFHLCIGTHQGTPLEELRQKRPVARSPSLKIVAVAVLADKAGACRCGMVSASR